MEIKEIISRKSPVNITFEEQSYVIREYIREKTGYNIPNIKQPNGEICPSLFVMAAKKGYIGNIQPSDFVAIGYAYFVAANYFWKKLLNNET